MMATMEGLLFKIEKNWEPLLIARQWPFGLTTAAGELIEFSSESATFSEGRACHDIQCPFKRARRCFFWIY